jgi:2-amino-4-hydroxy-6-hydroxymethyldihydropteridine diphosphokinase
MVDAYIGIGANLGKRESTMKQAVKMLGEHSDIDVMEVSKFVETEPVGGPKNQPKFLNGAVHLETMLGAKSLLNEMLEVEKRLGRTRETPWGPRTIDLDLLLYGDAIIDEPGLKVPHPRMHERLFVLIPLAEIAPDAVHPAFGMTVAELLERLQSGK